MATYPLPASKKRAFGVYAESANGIPDRMLRGGCTPSGWLPAHLPGFAWCWSLSVYKALKGISRNLWLHCTASPIPLTTFRIDCDSKFSVIAKAEIRGWNSSRRSADIGTVTMVGLKRFGTGNIARSALIRPISCTCASKSNLGEKQQNTLGRCVFGEKTEALHQESGHT